MSEVTRQERSVMITSQVISASRVKREQEAARDRLLRERTAPAREKARDLIKSSNKTLRAARRMLAGPAYVFVVFSSGKVFGDAKGRPYRKLSTAEGAAKAIDAQAYVLPIERWA